MLKQALGDSVLYAASAVLPRGIMLVLMPLITRLLGPAEYGALDLLVVAGVAVQLMVPLEVSQGLARHWGEQREAHDQRGYASASLWFSVAAYALFGFVAFVGAPAIAKLLLSDAGRALEIRLAASSIMVGGLLYLAHGQLRWALRVRAYMLVAALQALLVPGLAVTFASLRPGLVFFLLGQATGQLLVLLVALAMLRDTYTWRFSVRYLRPMLAFSLPLVPSGLAVLAAQYADRFLVKELMSIEDLGAYSVAARIGSFVALATLGLQLAITPLVYKHADSPDTPEALARLFRLCWGGALCCATALGLFADELVAFLAGAGYGQARSAVYLAALAAPAAGLYVYAPGLVLAKRTVAIALINTCAAVTGVSLGLLLVPMLGLPGAATATLGGASLGFTLYVVLGQKHLHVPYPWTRAFVVLGLSALTVLVAGHAPLLVRCASLLAFVAVVPMLLWPRRTAALA